MVIKKWSDNIVFGELFILVNIIEKLFFTSIKRVVLIPQGDKSGGFYFWLRLYLCLFGVG